MANQFPINGNGNGNMRGHFGQHAPPPPGLQAFFNMTRFPQPGHPQFQPLLPNIAPNPAASPEIQAMQAQNLQLAIKMREQNDAAMERMRTYYDNVVAFWEDKATKSEEDRKAYETIRDAEKHVDNDTIRGLRAQLQIAADAQGQREDANNRNIADMERRHQQVVSRAEKAETLLKGERTEHQKTLHQVSTERDQWREKAEDLRNQKLADDVTIQGLRVQLGLAADAQGRREDDHRRHIADIETQHANELEIQKARILTKTKKDNEVKAFAHMEQIAGYQKAWDDVEGQRVAAVNELDVQARRFQEETARLRAALTAKEGENGRLEGQLGEVTAERDQLLQEIQQVPGLLIEIVENKEAALLAKIDDLEAKFENARVLVNALIAAKKTADRDHEELRDALEHSLDEFGRESVHLRDYIARKESEFEDHTATLQRLHQNQVNELHGRVNDADIQTRRAVEEKERVDEENVQLRGKVNAGEEANSALQDQLDVVTALRNQVQLDNQLLQGQMEAANLERNLERLGMEDQIEFLSAQEEELTQRLREEQEARRQDAAQHGHQDAEFIKEITAARKEKNRLLWKKAIIKVKLTVRIQKIRKQERRCSTAGSAGLPKIRDPMDHQEELVQEVDVLFLDQEEFACDVQQVPLAVEARGVKRERSEFLGMTKHPKMMRDLFNDE